MLSNPCRYRPPHQWRHRANLHISTADRHEILTAWALTNGSRQDTSLDRFADAAFHKTELGKLYSLVKHLDICPYTLALIALPMVSLAFESGIAGFLALFNTTKEVLVCHVQVSQRRLQSGCIYLFQPRQGFLELCHIPRTGIVVYHPSLLLVEFFSQSEIVIPDEPTAAKCTLYLLYLRWSRIDAKFIAVFHYNSIQYFYAGPDAPYIPTPKGGGFTARSDKKRAALRSPFLMISV